MIFEIVVIILFILILLIMYYYYADYNGLKTINKKMRKTYENNINKTHKTPKIIMQTYHDKSKVPSKVYKNIQKFAPEYKHLIYDDDDCIRFLRSNYNDDVVKRFKSFKMGCHKADLFRYCWLYTNGGVYLDIKIKLIKPLKKIFTNRNTLYTVKSAISGTIFQGIISSPPNNPIFRKLINKVLNTPDIFVNTIYLIFTKHFYDELKKNKKHYNYKLFNEICDNKLNKDLSYDRYCMKCAIYDKNKERVFITRYSDYPW